jgi:hypothetical protein
MGMTGFRSEKSKAAAMGIAGFVYATVLGFLAIGLSGFGHGWMSGMFSLLGIIILPILAIGWVYRKVKIGSVCLWFALIGLLGTDGLIFFASMNEGFSYFHQTFGQYKGPMLLWLSMWLICQGFALFAAISVLWHRTNKTT